MKTLKFIAAALAIVAAASCVKDNNIDDNGRDNSSVELVEVSFQATIDSPSDPTAPSAPASSSSKTTLASDGITVQWSAGDQILPFPFTGTEKGNTSPYEGKGYLLTVDSETISEGFAKFSGTAVNSTSEEYRAIYPAAAVYPGSCYGNIYTFVSPTLASQTAQANNFSTTSWGVSNIAMAFNTPKDGIFKFKNVLAHFKFKVMVSGIRTIEFSTASATGISGLDSSVDIGGMLNYVPTSPTEGSFYLSTDYSITITNSGADFEVGTTYYVAIPALPMTGLLVVGKNSAGDGMFQFQRTRQFDPAPNTIYDLGGFSATVADALTVNPQTLTIPPAGGSATFTLTTNKDWTLVPSKDWTTVSPTSGGPGTHTITVTASANHTGASREPSYIDITAGTIVRSVSVNQAKLNAIYSRGDLVSGADAMENDAYYVILRQNSTNEYLANDNLGKLKVEGISDLNDIPVNNVFVYHKDDSKEVTTGTMYQQTSAGVFQSVFNGGYMDSDLSFKASYLGAAQHMTLGSHWGGTDPNIDIYVPVYTPNTGELDYYEFIAYVNGSISFKQATGLDNDLRKWYFYKVNVTLP